MNVQEEPGRKVFLRNAAKIVILALIGGCSAVTYFEKDRVDVVSAGQGAGAVASASAPPVAERLSVEEQARTATAERLLEEAKELEREFRFDEAEKRLEEAVRLDPNLTEAAKELDHVRFILGRLPGERGVTARQFYENQRLQVQQAQATVMRLFNEGEQLMAQKKYDAALERFQRVIEINSYFPWDLNMPDQVALARQRAVQAKRLHTQQLREERRKLEQETQAMVTRDRIRDLRYWKNKIRRLKKRAQEAYEGADFKGAQTLAQQLLELDPRNEEGLKLLAQARRMEHIFLQDKIYRETVKNWDLVFRGIDESAIPYQDIFRYPPRKVWEKVGTEELSLEEQVEREESLENRQIRRILDQKKIGSISFEDRPLKEVLDFLRRISGISFVPTREAQEAMAAGDDSMNVNLTEVQGLSVRNILELVLENVGEGYGYKIQNGAIVVGPLETLGRRLYLQFYSIDDIAKARPSYEAPPIAVNLADAEEGVEDAIIDLEEEPAAPVGVEAEQLVELINQRILGGDDMAEDQGTAEYQSGKLMVRTTLENHRKVRDLLESLRQLSGVLVTVEARFLDLQDNLLEEIGVEMGGPVESTLEYPIPDVNGLGTSVATGYAFIDESLRYEVRGANLTGYSGVLGTEITPFNITAEGGFGVQYATIDDYQLEAILTAVSKRQESRELSAPRVIAFDGQNSYTMVVDQIAYIKDVDVNQTGVSPVINPLVGSFRVGSILEIRPTVTFDRKYVILEVKPTTAQHVDSEFAQLSLAQGFTIVQVELPVILLAQIKTTITVPDGGTVLVGGLKKVIEQDKSIGIPVINRIPVLNIIFGRVGQTRLRNNLFVLIKAQIVIVREQERLTFPSRS